MASGARVRVDRRGVVETLHAPGVRSLLEEQVEAARDRCVAAYARTDVAPEKAPYGCAVQDSAGGVTLIGRVFTATPVGGVDNLRNNTLKKGTGW